MPALSARLTCAYSTVTKNDQFPASVGQWQPRVPKWRANLLAAYRAFHPHAQRTDSAELRCDL